MDEDNEKTTKRSISSIVTITDIARMAHVSKSTVSHVINHTRKVNDDTRNRVEKAIEETGYTQNFIAKSLKKAATSTIGLVVSDIQNPFFIDIIHAIDLYAQETSQTVMFCSSNDDSNRELQIIRSLYERRIDGLIFSPTKDANIHAQPFIEQIGLPTVLIDRCLDMEADFVGTENEKSTETLVNHLIRLGHRKIGMVAGTPGINTTEERIRGYKKALGNNDIEYNPDFVICGGSQCEEAERQILKLMDPRRNRPSAIVVMNNLMVLGVLRGLKKMNLQVPQDIALVSFDDFAWSDLFSPRLTTMAQPCIEIGVTAIKLLLKRIKEPTTPYEHVLLEPKFMLRDSCGYGRSNS